MHTCDPVETLHTRLEPYINQAKDAFIKIYGAQDEQTLVSHTDARFAVLSVQKVYGQFSIRISNSRGEQFTQSFDVPE